MMSRHIRPDSKVQTLCDHIYQLALERGPGKKLPTTRELCALFETSLTTLIEALRLLQEQQVIERRHGSGLYVSEHIHRKNICVLFYSRLFLRNQISPFWGMLWNFFGQEIEQRMADQDEYWSMHLVINQQEAEPHLPDSVVSLVEANILHGVLAIGIDLPTYQWLAARGIPVVTFASLGDATVEVDTAHLCQQGIQTLAEQGCKRIAFWGPFDEDTREAAQPDDIQAVARGDVRLDELLYGSMERLRMVYRALVHYGFPVEEHVLTQLIRPLPLLLKQTQWPTYQEQGYLFGREMFRQSPTEWPDGLLLFEDMFTDGLMTALYEMQIPVGENLKVVTVANLGSSTLFWCQRALSMLLIDPTEYVQTMFALLDTFLAGQTPTNPHVRLKTALQVPTAVSAHLLLE